MDKDEAKAVIKDMISSLIRDDAEAASQQLHDVLAAKMRDRLNPPSQENDDHSQDDDSQGDPDNNFEESSQDDDDNSSNAE